MSGARNGAEARAADPFGVARRRMVEEQLRGRGIRDERVLAAMLALPRHAFVEPALAGQSYGDHALPIGEGQTLSQPYIVARMLELLALEGAESVLEIGTGTGYQTALLARLVPRVYTVERVASLLRLAQRRLQALGIGNTVFRHGDGSLGWPEFSPYARILVSAGAPRVPDALREQLAVGGKLLIPVGGPSSQHLELWRREAGEEWTRERRGECRFVPLVGRDAWEKPPAE